MITTTIEATELQQLLYNIGIDPPEEGEVTEISHEEVVTQNGEGEPEKHETDTKEIQHEDGTVEKETKHDGVKSDYAAGPDDDDTDTEEDDADIADDDDDDVYEEDEAAENENDEHEIETADDVDEPDAELGAEKDKLSGPANDLIGQPSHGTSADDK